MDNTKKFTHKVENYVKYRPSYPSEFMKYLTDEVGITKEKIVADIGAGTGKLTKLLANEVKTVYAVEPNGPMRKACEEYCSEFRNVIAVDGTAEASTLPDSSVDFITVAQAFHWFDREKAGSEFKRILKPGEKVILVWNNLLNENEFIIENDALLRRMCPDFHGLSGGSRSDPENYADFFMHSVCDHRIFDNDRLLTLEEYIGGSLSSSYAPLESDPVYQDFVDGLTAIFFKYSKDGRLLMPSVTQSYTGVI